MKFWQRQLSMKCRSRVQGHGVCLLSMSRKMTMQGFMVLGIIGTEKDTLVFYLKWNSDKVNGVWNIGQVYWVTDVKFWQRQLSMKCRSRVQGHGACLLSMSRKMTMQGIMILAIKGTEKDILIFYLTWYSDKVNGAWNVGQGCRVMVHACRVCQGQILCKVSWFKLHRYRERHFSILLDANCWRKDRQTNGRKAELLYRRVR